MTTVAPRETVLLTVFIDCATLRWHAAGIDHQGSVTPLIRSESGDLAAYLGEELDHQISFLRHRLSGVLQRGCDRLWGREQKPCRIVIATNRLFSDAPAELTERVACHFVEWMANPPVVFLLLDESKMEHKVLAGGWNAEDRQAFDAGLPQLLETRLQEQLWELIPTRRPT